MLEEYFQKFRDQIVGIDATYESPYGTQQLVEKVRIWKNDYSYSNTTTECYHKTFSLNNKNSCMYLFAV